MREIKFRAWDKNLREMFYDRPNEVVFSWPPECHEIMQYTGLKDRNGKEIYEGDIVRRKGSDGVIEICEVVYIAPRFNIGNYVPEYGYIVVGNIHENLELLEGQE